MSKRHQSSRRRSYGRRQHELHERADRSVGSLSWMEEPDADGTSSGWTSLGYDREPAPGWLRLRAAN